jgi:hypothetical protein
VFTKVDDAFNVQWVFDEPSQFVQIQSRDLILPCAERHAVNVEDQYFRSSDDLLDTLSAKAMLWAVLTPASAFPPAPVLNELADTVCSCLSVTLVADREL